MDQSAWNGAENIPEFAVSPGMINMSSAWSINVPTGLDIKKDGHYHGLMRSGIFVIMDTRAQ